MIKQADSGSNEKKKIRNIEKFAEDPFHFVLVGLKCSQVNTHRKKVPSNETPAIAKSMNMDVWVVGTSNQLFIRGS